MRDKPAGGALSQEAETPVEKLRRWELYGGHWRVDSRASNQLRSPCLPAAAAKKPIGSSQLIPISSPTSETVAATRTTDGKKHLARISRSEVPHSPPNPAVTAECCQALGRGAIADGGFHQTDAPGSLQ